MYFSLMSKTIRLWSVSLKENRFVVDAADREKFETAAKVLQELLSKPPLAGIPLLVLANKNDLPGAATSDEIINAM